MTASGSRSRGLRLTSGAARLRRRASSIVTRAAWASGSSSESHRSSRATMSSRRLSISAVTVGAGMSESHDPTAVTRAWGITGTENPGRSWSVSSRTFWTSCG